MDVAETRQEAYEKLIETEDRLIRQLETCELAQEAILDQRSVCEEVPDLEAVEVILKSILALDAKLRLELLVLRLEKKKLVRKQKNHPL